jgi:hypothetical protein
VQRYYEGDDKLCKVVIDARYSINSPKLLCCHERNSSPFGKGVMWAAHAARMGYRWQVGNWKRVHFWEDQWFGTCSLAIQFWKFFVIVNEQGRTVDESSDGVNLKFTFR